MMGPGRTHPALGRRARSNRRLAGLLAALMALPLALGSCTADPHQGLSVSPLDASAVQDVEAQDPTSYDLNHTTPRPVQGASIAILATSRGSGDHSIPTITIISRSQEDNSLLWAITVVEQERMQSGQAAETYEDTPQETAPDLLDSRVTGTSVVSPDGRYLSVVLPPRITRKNRATIANQRARVLVLETASGRVVRSEEVAGLILGQALTNGALAVQTAQDYYPAGQGRGAIAVYPLEHGEPGPTTIPTDQWLVGAGQDSLLLSARSGTIRKAGCAPWCYPGEITQVDMSGRAIRTITGVIEVREDRRIERYTDPAQAAALGMRQAALRQEDVLRPEVDHDQEGEEIQQVWDELPTELVDIDAGSAQDADGT